MARVTIGGTVDNPDEVRVTLSISMPLADWKRLVEQLPSSNAPSWWLIGGIRKVIASVTAGVEETIHHDPHGGGE